MVLPQESFGYEHEITGPNPKSFNCKNSFRAIFSGNLLSEEPILKLQKNEERAFPLTRTRFLYSSAAAFFLVAGLISRNYRSHLPDFLAQYAGDTLWALMLYFMVSTILAGKPILVRGVVSFSVAFLVEVSQLYHAPWIDAIRRTTLGGLVLGFGFLWTDLVCYWVGIAIGSLVEWGVASLQRARSAFGGDKRPNHLKE